ncbi:MAG: hypothetical protein OXT06_09235 [Rhodospirillaceae bacterium]|nr:hypothetical protein [Rhodospirillaceae bacterium]
MGDLPGWVITVVGVAISLYGAWRVAEYRINRMETDRENDAKNFRAIIDGLSTKIGEVDERHRQNEATLFQRVDENRQAGAILESQFGALDPPGINDFIRETGAFQAQAEARLSRTELDLRRVEDHLLTHVQHDADRAND